MLGVPSRSSSDEAALMSLPRLNRRGGGTGAGGIGGGAGGETERDEFILNEPYLCPLSFSVSSRRRSVLLVCGFLSGDEDADDEVFLPKPNFFNVLLRDDFSMFVVVYRI